MVMMQYLVSQNRRLRRHFLGCLPRKSQLGVQHCYLHSGWWVFRRWAWRYENKVCEFAPWSQT